MPEWVTKVLCWIKRSEVQLTALYCLGFFGLGLVLAGFGPSIPDLREQTNTTPAEQSRVISVRAVGYLVGSAVGGPLFDKYPGNNLIAVTLLLCSFGTFFVPLVTTIWLEGPLVVLQGCAMGFLDTGGNVMTIFIWGREVEPYMQALHFSFGFGAFVAPLMISASHDLGFGMKGAWWTMAALFLPIALGLTRYASPKDPHKKDHSDPTKPLTSHEYWILGLTALFLATYVGTEVATGGFLVTFLEERGIADRDEAYLINSAFWGALSAFRLFAIPISLVLTPAQMLFGNMAGGIFSSAMLWRFVTSKTAWWISMLVFGASLASSFPTVINLAERYIKITGKAASIFVVGGSLGELLVPAGIGALLESTHYMALVYGMVLFSILQLVALFALWLKGSSRPRVHDEDTEVEIEDVVSQSHNLGLEIHLQAHNNAPLEEGEQFLTEVTDTPQPERKKSKQQRKPRDPRHLYLHEPLEALEASSPWVRNYRMPFSVGFTKLHEEGIPAPVFPSPQNTSERQSENDEELIVAYEQEPQQQQHEQDEANQPTQEATSDTHEDKPLSSM